MPSVTSIHLKDDQSDEEENNLIWASAAIYGREWPIWNYPNYT